MVTCTHKLVEVASASLCSYDSGAAAAWKGERIEEFVQLCEKRNGFYAFESALHIFPLSRECDQMTFQRWNSREVWRQAYGAAADGLEFFAEDVFGDQFAIAGNTIVSFNSETGETTKIGDTLEEWACSILTDHEFLTGYPFAHEWQKVNGPILPGQRLAPKLPFVFGGAYDITNVYVTDAVKAMLFKADVYRQLRDMPDGSRVKVTIER